MQVSKSIEPSVSVVYFISGYHSSQLHKIELTIADDQLQVMERLIVKLAGTTVDRTEFSSVRVQTGKQSSQADTLVAHLEMQRLEAAAVHTSSFNTTRKQTPAR